MLWREHHQLISSPAERRLPSNPNSTASFHRHVMRGASNRSLWKSPQQARPNVVRYQAGSWAKWFPPLSRFVSPRGRQTLYGWITQQRSSVDNLVQRRLFVTRPSHNVLVIRWNVTTQDRRWFFWLEEQNPSSSSSKLKINSIESIIKVKVKQRNYFNLDLRQVPVKETGGNAKGL